MSGLIVPGYRRDHQRVDPPNDSPAYRGTALRHPNRPLIAVPETLNDLTGPALGESRVEPGEADLTAGFADEPQGQRIVVHGQVLDGDGRPLRDSLIEVWQANAAGRYRHAVDDHPAPLDPNFNGVGRCLTDADGRYRFVTIRPGAYPWRNHFNAWRPAHIHFSLFGRAFAQRLVTQMYFPGDELLPLDPIYNSVRDPRDRARLICGFDLEATVPERALGYRFDIVLRGHEQTPFEEPGR